MEPAISRQHADSAPPLVNTPLLEKNESPLRLQPDEASLPSHGVDEANHSQAPSLDDAQDETDASSGDDLDKIVSGGEESTGNDTDAYAL